MENDENPTAVTSNSVEQTEIDRLNELIKSQTNEITEFNSRFVHFQQHYENLLAKQKDENAKEKQLTVMRYAQAEKAKLDADRRFEISNSKNCELTKEKENLQLKLAEMKLLSNKLQQAFDTKVAELTTMKKDLEKTKELNQSIDATLKSTLNHLKGESASLREQKEINEKLRKELAEQQELNKQLHENLQSVPTDDERSKAFETLRDEYEALKTRFSTIQDENIQLKDKLKSIDEDRTALENVLESFRQNAAKEKEKTKNLYDELLAARENDLTEISRLKQIENVYNQTLADNADLRQLLAKEHEFLVLTQNLTEKNSILQIDFEQMKIFNEKLRLENEKLLQNDVEQKFRLNQFEKIEETLKTDFKQIEEKFEILKKNHDEVLRENEDLKIEIVNLKKKHQANTKDLIKQLQQLQKSKTFDDVTTKTKENLGENSSRGSRTSSTGSTNENSPIVVVESPPIPSKPVVEEETDVIVNIVDIDRQKLIEKLLKQQKLLVRRNEKIEFLNDHIVILTQDLQNKRKIIQSYAMNEDAFMYTSNQSDSIKQQLAEKSRSNSSSLMATLYNRATTVGQNATHKILPQFFHDQSSTMNLETALDIMGKLQSVLEDTLLKNITLKENVDTLSKEIERLSKRTKT